MFPRQRHDNTDRDVSVYYPRVFAATGETKCEQGKGEEACSFAFLNGRSPFVRRNTFDKAVVDVASECRQAPVSIGSGWYFPRGLNIPD